MTLPTREKGELQLLAVWQKDGHWEPEWEPLRGTPFGDLLSVVPEETLNHALTGWSRPLVQALGISPEGALRKIPKEAQQCLRRSKCPLYDAKCVPLAREMPWCFEPDGVKDDGVRYAASRVIEEWRAKVYVVIVTEG
jgi:hypothetical protein